MKPKSKSLTLWFHGLTLASLVVTYLIEKELLTGEVLAGAVAVQSVVGWILRLRTKVPLE